MKTVVLFALAFAPLTLADQVGNLTGLPNQPFLYVEGKATVEKAPDLVVLNFDIETHNPEQGKANQEVQAKAKRVFALLKQAKIEDRDIVAEDVESDAEYERDESDTAKRGRLMGYVVSRQFKITVRDVAKYGQLGDQIMQLGGVKLSRISSQVSNSEKIGEELWPKAIEDAREKAEKTLKPLALKIESVFAVSSIAFEQVAPEFLKSGDGVIVTGMNIPTPPDQPSEYRLEVATIESRAHVIYLISPAK